MVEYPSTLKTALEKMHYEFIGNHSALEICSWTKKSLRDEGVCYKQKFYGIKSHRCCQMSPAAGFCDQKCVFCWRPHELNLGTKMNCKVDEPGDIIKKCIAAQRRKLSGFGGNDKINLQKFKEAQNPNQWAISLTGEPTLYPKLGEFIADLHTLNCTTFLVTNGLHPEVLQKLSKRGNLPTQLYVSIDAPTQELHKKINVPLIKKSWEQLNKTLKLLPKLNCRKVLRLTLIKGLNDLHIKEWIKLIKEAGEVWVETKAYMHIGYSRKRLEKENMPTHTEVKAFSKKLARRLGWRIIDEQAQSRVCLLAKKDSKKRFLNQLL